MKLDFDEIGFVDESGFDETVFDETFFDELVCYLPDPPPSQQRRNSGVAPTRQRRGLRMHHMGKMKEGTIGEKRNWEAENDPKKARKQSHFDQLCCMGNRFLQTIKMHNDREKGEQKLRENVQRNEDQSIGRIQGIKFIGK